MKKYHKKLPVLKKFQCQIFSVQMIVNYSIHIYIDQQYSSTCTALAIMSWVQGQHDSLLSCSSTVQLGQCHAHDTSSPQHNPMSFTRLQLELRAQRLLLLYTVSLLLQGFITSLGMSTIGARSGRALALSALPAVPALHARMRYACLCTACQDAMHTCTVFYMQDAKHPCALHEIYKIEFRTSHAVYSCISDDPPGGQHTSQSETLSCIQHIQLWVMVATSRVLRSTESCTNSDVIMPMISNWFSFCSDLKTMHHSAKHFSQSVHFTTTTFDQT